MLNIEQILQKKKIDSWFLTPSQPRRSYQGDRDEKEEQEQEQEQEEQEEEKEEEDR